MPCAVAKEGRIPARLRLGRFNDDDEPALGPFGETFEAFIVPEFVEPLEVMERFIKTFLIIPYVEYESLSPNQ